MRLLFNGSMNVGSNAHNAEVLTWFKEIFDTYYDSIRNYAWYKTGSTALADDIVQEVFLKLWQMRSKIEPATIKPLLYTIATNLIKSHYRHLKVVYRFERRSKEEDIGIILNSADEALRIEEFQSQLETLLSQMPAGARETLLMSRLENLTYEEIAKRLGISIKAVEKRMSIALKFLRDKIDYKI
ncbi:MAG: RNA polymerase sigma-70 factor [Bacteroidales bacterium]|nr:RNA polymerase sigma-70 factor [Bacteroidales bacterium]